LILRFLENPGPGKITNLLSLSMVIIFLGLGFLFLITDAWIDRYPRPTRTYIGLVLAGWSVFRGISVWLKMRRAKREEEDEY
jgi:hypothetical protein